MLADIFVELLMSKDDYLRSLRALLREIVRTLRHDFTFHPFCLGLMEDRRTQPAFVCLDTISKERVLLGITDLVAVCELLTITPAVREAASTVAWGDKRKGTSYLVVWHRDVELWFSRLHTGSRLKSYCLDKKRLRSIWHYSLNKLAPLTSMSIQFKTIVQSGLVI